MSERKRNSTLGAALNGKAFQLESGVFSGIEGLGEFSYVIFWNCRPFLWSQAGKQL
jgi:hypothetical protein